MGTPTETRIANLSKNLAHNVHASLARVVGQQRARLAEKEGATLQTQRSLNSRSRLAEKGLNRILEFAQNPQLQEILRTQMQATPGSGKLFFHELAWCRIGVEETSFHYIMFNEDGVILSTRNTCHVTQVCYWKFFFDGKVTRSAGFEYQNPSPDQGEEIDRPSFFKEIACTEKIDLRNLAETLHTKSPYEGAVVFQTLVNLAHEKAFDAMVEEFLSGLERQFRS